MSTITRNIRIGILGNLTKENITRIICETVSFLKGKKISIFIEENLGKYLLENHCPHITVNDFFAEKQVVLNSDIIVVFGGDGTMLAAVQTTIDADKPLLGVNLGKLGFLAEVRPEEIIKSMQMMIDGEYTIEPRLILQCESESLNTSLIALNDIVVSKSGLARVIKMNTFVDDEFLASFHADGIIVSTPTGSTAYSLATGGPIVVPTSDVIIISPISAHTLTARPVIVPHSARIRIDAIAEEGEIIVMADGQVNLTSEHFISIQITQSDRSVKLIKRNGSSYFETLRNKLMWGKDTRISNPENINSK